MPKRPKRSHGEGTVFFVRKDLWRATVSLGKDPVTGKRVRKSAYATTKAEAQRKRQQLLEEHHQARSSKTITISQRVDAWDRAKSQKVRESSIETYEREIRLRIVPTIGDKPAAQIDYVDTDSAACDRHRDWIRATTARATRVRTFAIRGVGAPEPRAE